MKRSRRKRSRRKPGPGRNRKMFNGRPGRQGYISRRIANSPAAQVMTLDGGPEAIGELFGYDRKWHTDRTQSICEYPLRTGTCGNPTVIEGHTISVPILNRVGEIRPGDQEVRVLSLSLDIAGLTERIAKPDTECSQRFYNESRWVPEPIGIGSASVRFFSCRDHDQEWFRSIERDDGPGIRHPLDTSPLEPEQYFLLSNRIVQYAVEELRRADRAFASVFDRPASASIPPDILKERQVSIRDHTDRLNSILDRFLQAKEDFQAGYRKKDFVSLIDTPIDRVLQLPVRIAISDIYSIPGNDVQGSVFLTVYPCESSPAQNGLYNHRVIVSHLKEYTTEVRPTVDIINQLPGDVGRFRGKGKKLLRELLSRTRNAYFSYDFERNLTAIDRRRMEKLAYKESLDSMPPWFKRDLLGMS